MPYRVYSSQRGGAYQKVGQDTVFARVGTLAVNYPWLNDSTLDNSATGMLINVAGVDTDFPSTDDNGFERGELLIFVDDEIMTYETATVVSPTQVRLTNIVHGQHDTIIAGHAAGATVYVMQAQLVHSISYRRYKTGDTVSFKVAPSTGKLEVLLTEVDPIVMTLTGKSIAPRSPQNLVANGVGLNPTFASGTNITFGWTQTDFFRPEFWQTWDEHVQLRTIYRVAIYDSTFTTQKRRTRTPIYAGSWVYTAAERTADFGGEPSSFGIRVFARRRGVASSQYLQLVVTKA